MQNAQNTFYITLRNRLATLNPSRTIYLRGVTRPGILVEGNELVIAEPYSDVFLLRWKGLQCDPYLAEVMPQSLHTPRSRRCPHSPSARCSSHPPRPSVPG